MVKQHNLSTFRRWGNRNRKPTRLLKATRTVASQKLLPASPSQTLQHTTEVSYSTNHLVIKRWFLIPFPRFNCYFSPQKGRQESERSKGMSTNTFHPVPSAWWPAQSPGGEVPHFKGYQQCTALLVSWSKRPNSEWPVSADCHWQRWHPKAGLVEQDSIHSSSSLLRKGFLPVKSFTCTSLLRPHQQEYLGSSLLMRKNQHKQESSPGGFCSVFHGNVTHHNHILGIYYMFHCFHISEQNKTPSCMLWYQTVQKASLPDILKYQ